MSEYRSSRSNISRQFTEAENAIDDRLTAHLTAPPIEMQIGDRIGQSYQWLSEDLALRSTLSKQLAGEQAMAYAQSTRHELANQAIREQDDDREAVEGMKLINESIASGKAKDWSDAASQFYADRPGAFLNPKLSGMVTEGGKYFQTDKSREIAELRQANEVLKLGTDKFDLEQADKMRDQFGDRMFSIMKDQFKANETTASGALGLAQLRNLETVQGLREAEERSKVLNSAGVDPNGRAKAQYALMESGLDIADVSALTGNFRGTATLGMLSDRRWLASNVADPEAIKELSDSVNVVNSPDAKPADKAAARAKVDRLTGKYIVDTEEAVKFKERSDILQSIGDDTKESYDKFSEDIGKLATNKDSVKSKDTPMEVVSRAKGWMRQHAGASAMENAVVKEYTDYLDSIKLEGAKAPETVATARDLAGKFAQKLAQARMVNSVRGPIPTTPSASTASPEMDAATKWIAENPNDPRVPAIKAKLGIK